jgi:hypothetical protein
MSVVVADAGRVTSCGAGRTTIACVSKGDAGISEMSGIGDLAKTISRRLRPLSEGGGYIWLLFGIVSPEVINEAATC